MALLDVELSWPDRGQGTAGVAAGFGAAWLVGQAIPVSGASSAAGASPRSLRR